MVESNHEPVRFAYVAYSATIPYMRYQYDDGGRSASGFRGDAGDCVTRAIAIATGEDYRVVYDALAAGEHSRGRAKSARNGVSRKVYEPYLLAMGWEWTPTMSIGSGCQVHLREGEIPDRGRFVVQVSHHVTSVIDGVIHDTYDPSRDGTRCVYGYYAEPGYAYQL